MTEFQNCIICGNPNFHNIYLRQWSSSHFVQCKNCGLIFQNPQEDIQDTQNRYSDDYFKYEQQNEENFFQLIKKTMEDFQIFSQLPKNAKILEIGSATGLFLNYVKQLGYQETGIEICQPSVEYGRKKYGVNLLNCQLEEANFKDQSFDFVHFSHLIEHLNRPDLFLKEIYRILKPGGWVNITTPNSSGWFANYYQENWRCIVDDHLFLFNQQNLKKLLTNHHFKVIRFLSWGSIPAGKSKQLKAFTDWLVKKTGKGDVMSFLIKKKKK
ncbi:MAG: methyltransferase domain-containing protein [Spirochaetes bacterium]|nr:methyltransferase domain-containing protein [Spirochaetota bacterium]